MSTSPATVVVEVVLDEAKLTDAQKNRLQGHSGAEVRSSTASGDFGAVEAAVVEAQASANALLTALIDGTDLPKDALLTKPNSPS